MNRSRWPETRSPEPAGFSTLGALVSLTLLGLVLGPILSTVISGQRSFVSTWERTQAAASARYAHLALTRLMRGSGSHPIGGPIQGIDPDPSGDGIFDDVRLKSDYNPPDGDTDDPGEDLTFYVRSDTMYVRWGAGAPEEPYLIGVDSLAFEYFERDGSLITDPALVSTDAASARITIRASSYAYGELADRTLVGRVRLRNGR